MIITIAAAIRKIALEFAAAGPYGMIPTYKRDAAGPNYANSWRLRHAINILNTLVGSIDHEGGVLLLHDVKIPWIDEISPPVLPYPEQPKEPVDFRNEFPVTDTIYRKKDFSAPGHPMTVDGLVAFTRASAENPFLPFLTSQVRGLLRDAPGAIGISIDSHSQLNANAFKLPFSLSLKSSNPLTTPLPFNGRRTPPIVTSSFSASASGSTGGPGIR